MSSASVLPSPARPAPLPSFPAGFPGPAPRRLCSLSYPAPGVALLVVAGSGRFARAAVLRRALAWSFGFRPVLLAAPGALLLFVLAGPSASLAGVPAFSAWLSVSFAVRP